MAIEGGIVYRHDHSGKDTIHTDPRSILTRCCLHRLLTKALVFRSQVYARSGALWTNDVSSDAAAVDNN